MRPPAAHPAVPVRASRRPRPKAVARCSLFPVPCSLLLALSACSGPGVLNPAGPAARRIAVLTWIFIALSVAVTLAVIAITAYAALHRRPPGFRAFADADVEPGKDVEPERDRRSIRWIVYGGAVVPAVILVALFVGTMVTLNALSATRPDAPLSIEVTGRQWWWEVRYVRGGARENDVVSANEIHIPTGTRIPVLLKATDVIHSFWVPALNGKTDLIPGRTNVTWIQADETGVFGGRCAEYCGVQHTRMELPVIAHAPEEFERWLAAQARDASPDPQASQAARHAAHGHGTMEGRDVFVRAGCGYCHTIRGTEARGTVGPDLTHFGGRRTIAAGALPNTRGHLEGWIANPQALKPGARMPRVPLRPDELHAVANYLLSLR